MHISLFRSGTVPAFILAAGVLLHHPAAAQDVFDNLQAEPVTMLDFGIKRLRSAALQTSLRLAPPSDPKAQSQVHFDPVKREIRLNYVLAMRQDGVSLATCWERRAAAIREVFFVGGTSYSAPLSVEQRIKNRLGAMFTREPVDRANAQQAMGERLAESTFVTMSIAVPGGAEPITCEGRVAELRLK